MKLRIALLARGMTPELVGSAIDPPKARPTMPMDLLIRRLYENHPLDDDEGCFYEDEDY